MCIRTNGIACPCINVVRLINTCIYYLWLNSRCPLYGVSVNRGSTV